MPKFTGTEDKVLTINAPLDVVVGVMAKPDVFVACLGDLDKHEKIDDTTFRWILIEKNEKGVRFSGDYTVKYDFNGADLLKWTTVSNGNMSSEGEAHFTAQGNSTKVAYRETIVCDMEVNRLLAKVIKPIVSREIAKGVSGYLDRCKALCEK
jgi:carbon monoxide dehydrogenase subunit G